MKAATHPPSATSSARTKHWSEASLRVLRAAICWLTACIVVPLGLSSCGDVGSNAPSAVVPSASATALIGPAGGTLTGPDGVQVVVPAGALNQATTIGIARSSAGAPDALDAFPAAGNVYEFTPHDVIFNSLVTISAPVPAGASGTQVFMASPGGNWRLVDALVANGVAQWQRNSFSYGYYGTDCFVPTVMNNDPYWCVNDRSSARIIATPALAMTQTSVPNVQLGDAGSYRVDQAANLQMTSTFGVAGNCRNVSVAFKRRLFNATSLTWSTPTTVSTQTPALVVNGGVLKGTATFPLFATHLDNGKHHFAFVVSFECPKVTHAPGSSTVTGWDLANFSSRTLADGMVAEVNIAVPTVVFTVGGTVSGLTGAGLVLQNSGTNFTPVAANGSFTFSASLGAGAPYSVTVLTQPAGQTCTVTNGSGTANANVSNVAVNCVATHSIGGSVSGLVGTGLVLQNNGADNLAFTVSGAFTFATRVLAGATYNVTVLSQPSGSTCTLTNGTGTANADVTNVAVTCTSAGGLALVANSGVTNGTNGLSVYRVNSTTGALSFLSNVNAGNAPYAVAVTPNGRFAYVSNQVGGTVSSYNIDSTTGVVSLIPLSSPGSNNASGIAMDRLGRFIWVANFGFNTLSAFAIDSNGVLAAVGAPVSTLSPLPYAITAHPTLDFVYVAHASGFAITVYSVNPANGALTLRQTLSNAITSPSGMVIDPSGRFAYAISENGGVSAFGISASTGLLTTIGSVGTGGATFAIVVHPNGQYVYVTNGSSSSNNVLVFAINPSSGALTPVGSPYSAGNNPRGITVNAAGTFLYVTNLSSNDVSAFSIGGGGGTLTSLGTAVATGSSPQGIATTP